MRSIFTITFTLLCLYISAQESSSKPSVFLDCQTNCYLTYLRQEVSYLNYARDRQGADVYVLVTAQNASAGAREIQMIFLYDGISQLTSDTIKYYREANISDLEEMELFKKNFKQGMLPVLAVGGMADKISYEVESSEVVEELEFDPWNYWSFNVSLNLDVNGEASFEEQGYFGRVSGSRVTEKEKITLISWYNFDKSSFTLSDSSVVKSENERFRVFGQYVKSIGDHWAVGVRSLVGSSTFGNTDFSATVRPAVEFNVFPYSVSSTKRFSFMYTIGGVYNDYTELTVFDKTKETLARHGLDIEYEQTQPWGSTAFDIRFDQYLRDLSLYSISFNPNIELNIVKGLRLQFGGFVSFVGDRINITKGEVSDQDIILQNRQLDTNYSYSTYFGFNYRFGSKNNNIVNPRF